MNVGQRVADRWELVAEAGRGGMGAVYRARDVRTGEPAAVKVLSGNQAEHAARFEREARLLAELRHPGIVRYLQHGATADDERWIAMEWLEGETLMHHLRGNRTSVDEALAMARGAAAALAYAHGQGVVHRDVKPSNLFLCDGRIDRVKLVDFGIARGGEGDLTRTGTRVGTPTYMAPEQVRGARDLDGRCDVFALGVVLYQCLTRRRPFWSSDPRITLTKILTWDPPPVSFSIPGVPRALDEVVAQTLAKDPPERFDALQLLAALEALGRVDEVHAGAIPALTEEEQRLQAVVVAHTAGGSTVPIAEIATRHGATLETVSAMRVVARLSSNGAATDLAARAAGCALAMKARVPEATVAITLGRGATGASRPGVDEILRRGGVLGAGATTVVRQEDDSPPIRVDRLVAQLLGERFDVGRDGAGWTLRGETTWTPRVLLGRPTVCVAREAELAAMRAAFEAVADEPMAKALLITAPAGTGKSRLRYEFLHALRASGEHAEVLVGRGDPLRAGTPYGLLATAIREAAGIRDGEPPETSRRKLAARVPGEVEFLGELAGVPFPDDDNVQLRAARADAVLMADQIGRAFEGFLDGIAQVHPVVLVLEDLHWADAPTIRLVDAALRNLRDRPLLVLATARPEIEDQKLWADRELQHIRLGPLPKRAARRLVRDVLGDDVADSAIEHLIERAAGNAFYLEELIRVAADGDPREVPDTVLAMVQARLEAMEPAARRVLRAASVFGRAFWTEGVARLVGADARESTGLWLGALADREVFQRRSTSRLTGQEEYTFRHDLVREAAYAMLTDADRALGHRLAGEWLDQAGEADAGVLAEHFDRGGDAIRAVDGYTRAAQHALESHDVDGGIARAERGLACGAAGQARGALLALLAEAHVWRGRFRSAMEAGEAALTLLPPGTRVSYAVVAELAVAAGVQGDADTLIALTALIVALPDEAEGRQARLRAATRLAEQLLILGRAEATRPLFAMFDAADLAEQPGLAGRVHSARALLACFVGDVEGNVRHVDEAVACFERAGDRRGATTKRERAGYTRMDLGAYAEAEGMLRDACTAAEQLQLANVAATARHNLGLALGRLGRHAEAIAVETEAAERFRASGNRRMEGAAREYLALIRFEAGDPVTAEAEAREALRLSREPTLLPLNEAESLAILARVLVAQGRTEEAVDAAGAGLRRLESLGGIDDGEALIRLAWAEALQAAGRGAEAAEAGHIAAERLQARAARMSEPWRTSFLQAVPENRQTLELGRPGLPVSRSR